MKLALIFLLVLLSACADGEIREPEHNIDLYFCPPENCTAIMLDYIPEESDIHCALYDVDLPILLSRFSSLSVIVLDEDAPFVETKAKIVREHGDGLMHNKFCITGDTLLTGTFNPTMKGEVNSNLLMVTSSPTLIRIFYEEFDELADGTFHGGSRGRYQTIALNSSVVSVRFCPEDECEKSLLSVIAAARSEILFMSFTITSESIVRALIEAKSRGVIVHGIVEPFQSGNAWAIPELEKNGIKIERADVPGLFHHKAFIVDRTFIVTGSYNPTKSANEKNDEALLLVESPQHAKKFVDYFGSVLTSP